MAHSAKESKNSLIDSWFPMTEVGVESVRERSTSQVPGVNSLHVWFARRPLVTSRAAILASILPEDTDKKQFLRLIGIPVGKNIAAAVKLVTEAKAQGRKLTTNPFTWERAFSHTPSSEEAAWLKSVLQTQWEGRLPVILDPMAGGGSIPYEATRLGLPALAGDLNPVAYVILKATVEYPAKFGEELIPSVKEFCGRVSKLAIEELGQFYPKLENERIYAYIWSRTVKCQHCGFLIPLSPNWWIVNSEDLKIAVRPIPQTSSDRCTFEIAKNPKKIGFNPDDGTDVGKDAKCINVKKCGKVNDGDYVKAEAKAGRLGHQLVAICAKSTNSVKSKKWEIRTPKKEDIDAFEKAGISLREKLTTWEKRGLVPTERFREQFFDARPVQYGMSRWCDLFNQRQLLTHLTFLEKFNQVKHEYMDGLGKGSSEYEFAKAVTVYAAMVFDRCVDNNCLLSLWNVNRTGVAHAMGLQGFPFKTSYAEWDDPTMLWPWATGKTIDALSELIELLPKERNPAITFMADAAQLPTIGGKSIPCIVVDPPYAENVMYGELMDFFYVWQKRLLGDLFAESFRGELTNTSEEAVANSSSFREAGRGHAKQLAKQYYQSKMEACFRKMNEVLSDDGRMTVMFTHKEAEAWASLATSLMKAGFTFRASWPVFTEPGAKFGKNEKGVLKATVLLACQKRLVEKRGLWEEVQRELYQEAESKVREHDKAGITGPDLIVSTYGPVLGRFADYAVVKDATGKVRGPDDALEVVAEVVNRFLTADIPSADLETLAYLNLVRSFPFLAAEYDLARLTTVFGGNISLEALDIKTGTGLLEKKGDKVHILSAIKRAELGVINPYKAETLRTLIDTVHASLIIYEKRGLQSVKDLLVQTNRDSSDSGFLGVLRVLAQLGLDGNAAEDLVIDARTANALLEALGQQPETVHQTGESLLHYPNS